MTKHPTRRTVPSSLRAYLAGPPVISQRMLAAAVGCNQAMISLLIRGARIPSPSLAAKLHAITGVPLRVLLAARMARATGRRPRRRSVA